MVTNKSVKICKTYECKLCEYVTRDKRDYDKHLSTGKHKMVTNGDNEPFGFFECECGNSYKYRQGLSRHKKKCTIIEEEKTENKIENKIENKTEDKTEDKLTVQNNGGGDTELVVKLMNTVATQQQTINELIPKLGNNTNCNNTMNNTTNNKFNMNIYLNEKCKDAMTLTDFIDNLKITDADFATTRTEGIVSGLTDIFTNELRDLDVRKLPIHCSDIRRETFYIKEEDKWVKDDSKKSILSRAIDKAKGKANKFLPVWIDEHPDCWKSDSPYHTEWMNVVTIRFGDGDPKFNEKNTKKILKNIAAEVLIDKETAMIDE